MIDVYQKFSKKNRQNNGNHLKQYDDPIILLEKLAKLKESGILTEEEFRTKKKEILNRL